MKRAKKSSAGLAGVGKGTNVKRKELPCRDRIKVVIRTDNETWIYTVRKYVKGMYIPNKSRKYEYEVVTVLKKWYEEMKWIGVVID